MTAHCWHCKRCADSCQGLAMRGFSAVLCCCFQGREEKTRQAPQLKRRQPSRQGSLSECGKAGQRTGGVQRGSFCWQQHAGEFTKMDSMHCTTPQGQPGTASTAGQRNSGPRSCCCLQSTRSQSISSSSSSAGGGAAGSGVSRGVAPASPRLALKGLTGWQNFCSLQEWPSGGQQQRAWPKAMQKTCIAEQAGAPRDSCPATG